nr:hypothetical protein [Gordonia sp. (in: high G+C Gram-positive bacteria)]
MRTTDPAAIVVDDVTVRYGDVVALDGASLTLRAGTVCGLVGTNPVYSSSRSTACRTTSSRTRCAPA